MTSAPTTRILAIDDDPALRRFLRECLEPAGYELEEADSGLAGLAKATGNRADGVILDLNLPDLSGIEVLRRLRAWSRVPVVVLSASTQENRIVTALDLGADNYLTKPISAGVLLAQLRGLLRRTHRDPPAGSVKFGEVEVDLDRIIVTRRGTEITLSAKEHALLREMARNAGRPLTHRHLLRAVWGSEFEQHTEYLHTYMARLRRKLEENPDRPVYFRSLPGVGFILGADPETPPAGSDR